MAMTFDHVAGTYGSTNSVRQRSISVKKKVTIKICMNEFLVYNLNLSFSYCKKEKQKQKTSK
jgi:hypothetical protein